MQTDSKNPQGNETNTLLYTVRVICWDGVEYTRKATKDEIDTQKNKLKTQKENKKNSKSAEK